VRLPGAEDTIAAIATPSGRGALAVVRLSGPAAHAIGARVLEPWRATPRLAYRAILRHPDSGVVVEHPVVTVYAGPKSYTGEDSVELSVHGGAVAPAVTLAALFAAGARQALPGEFTRRAVAHGKLDVLQAEAVADAVDARSRAMFTAAQAQLEGGLSRRIAALRDAILHVEALIAYDIDFPEEDEGPVDEERVLDAVQRARSAVDTLLATAETGEMVRSGATVVIAGAPNTGKSSLFNALVGDARAIVTEIPGTTRDAIEAVIDVGRWPVRLIDTAGLRATGDVVERLGIEVSERWLARADLVLACGDSAGSLETAVERVGELFAEGGGGPAVIAVRTKGDAAGGPPEFNLPDEGNPRGIGSAPSVPESRGDGSPAGEIAPAEPPGITVSAHTGAGLAALTHRIQDELSRRHHLGDADAPLLTRERHVRAVQVAREELDHFLRARRSQEVPATIAAVHLRAATHALESLIGVVDVEDVLDLVFRSFCVGK
jgi:tRNA modification GTPase